MQILTTPGWSDYELLDSGDGQRLERFGKHILVRPDPQIIWKKKLPNTEWEKADAVFQKGSKDKGEWIKKTAIPSRWLMKWDEISFYAELSPFKHTGVFPEQVINWEWITSHIERHPGEVQDRTLLTTTDPGQAGMTENSNTPNILNLFGYTGIASLVAASAGAKVTHIDGSFPTIGWAKENQKASKLEDRPIRWILDDALKFVQREERRGVKYDGILMDPPVYGHGPKGEVWDFNDSFPALIESCSKILSDNPLFFLVNAYAISSSSIMLENVLNDYLPKGNMESGELALEEKSGKRLLSTGIFARISW